MSAVELYRSKLLDEAGFTTHGFTKRKGGVSTLAFQSLNLSFDVGDDPSNVVENLSRLKGMVGQDKFLVRVKQVHRSKVVGALSAIKTPPSESSWTEPPFLEADGLVNSCPELVLAVQTADCAPVLIASKRANAVAAIHAGWRSLSLGVVRNGVKSMVEMGAGPAEMIAVIGPCICGNCYEVGDEVARNFPESCDPIKGKPGKHLLDLGLAVEVSLIGAGLRGDNIERIQTCTYCSEAELFSHRRDNGTTGRTLGFISTQ